MDTSINTTNITTIPYHFISRLLNANFDFDVSVSNDVVIDVAKCALPGKVMQWSPCPEVRTLTNENGRYIMKFNDNVFYEENMCSSAAHWKCPILQNTFKAFNICCIFGVQIVFYTWTNVLEHVQTFSTWCSNSVLPGENVQYLVFKQCSFPLNTMVFNITEHVQGVQCLLQFWRSDGVLNLNINFYSVGNLSIDICRYILLGN